MLAAISSLLRVGTSRGPGPVPTYNSSHVLLAMLAIGKAESIGRHRLAEEAGLGEGAVRTVIKWLKEDGYIEVKSDGCQLTGKGRRAYSELSRLIPRTIELSKTSLSVGKVQVAVLVRKKAGLVKTGIEQRDSAIKAGADGATTYIVRNSRIQVPGSSSDAEKDYPSKAWAELKSGLQPEDGDAVIVCGSGSPNTASLGAINAALTLLA